ncbi:hypothetical protein K470DRAFT_258056 [Piedraia hortae CBS 480.64]|uniref:Inositol hexakisphosphate and diphosphoinositol-pentakisphosphate kinase n=1 Tax=Piedraia hortae CBS 480.64 TaxID=1314780 RepID=A0A6A7BYJ7_9PEZI|nr:hypothetical protein K470DRAFT_258056 [Piedraia hortae CBS 480.64]
MADDKSSSISDAQLKDLRQDNAGALQSSQSLSGLDKLGNSAPAATTPAPSRPSRDARLARGRAAGSRPVSSSISTSGSPSADRPPPSNKLGTIGICALDSKARSKPSRNILNRIIGKDSEFEVIIFGDKIILDEDVRNWPLCDYLISFFSDGFPLEKAIEYVKLRKPFCVNDLQMQTILWDRRLCLGILDQLGVPTPDRIEVSRDGGPVILSPSIAKKVYELTGLQLEGSEDGRGGGQRPPKDIHMEDDDDTLVVDGKRLTKPFVEKPTSGEDHNINIYFSKSQGGGGRRLFRKINNKSSEKDDSLTIPRAVTDKNNSYIYEQFLKVENAEDVKAYTVGPDYCHAETRKSPVVDGVVRRNPNGKEIRYITPLTKAEQVMASKIATGFGQRVCGFDLLRMDDKSYVIDVNGWSFVKDNNEYYDKCASILKGMFIQERRRRENLTASSGESNDGSDVRSPDRSNRRSIASDPLTLEGVLGSNTSKKFSSSAASPLASPPLTMHDALRMPPAAVQKDALPVPPRPDKSGERRSASADPCLLSTENLPAPAAKSQWKLKGMVAVIRHADRTPKQKFKYTFHTEPFVELLRGHEEEVLLVGEAALDSVIKAVQRAMEAGEEDMSKLQQLDNALKRKKDLPGTKVQIKPLFKRPKSLQDNTEAVEKSQERSDSLSEVTRSRDAAKDNNLVLDKLQLVIKWGGEPTHSARYQAADLGENMRNDLLLMNRHVLDTVSVFTSSERRVTTSAQIFTSAFLDEEDIPEGQIVVRKDLLDDSNAAKDEMDKVKKKLKGLLRQGHKAPEQFAWPKDGTPEPYVVVRNVVELMKFHQRVMRENFDLGSSSSQDGTSEQSDSNSSEAVSNVQARWCTGEDAALFRERWEKLFDEFQDTEKVDPGKISELYDTMKYDALHNRQFLEWAFTPSKAMLTEQEDANDQAEGQSSRRQSNKLSEKIGFGRRSHDLVNVAKGAMANMSAETESYFNLYRGPTGGGVENNKLVMDARLSKLNELYLQSKVLFDFIGPQEYGITDAEKLEIGLLTSLPLLKEIVLDLEEVQASDDAKSFIYFTKESHIYTLLNCILEGGITTKIARNAIPELDYLSQICFELYESENADEPGTQQMESTKSEDDKDENYNYFNYSIRITISPGCHTFDPLSVQLDSKHCIGCAQRRSLTPHGDWKEVLETLRAKFDTVKLPKRFTAVNLSEKVAGGEF